MSNPGSGISQISNQDQLNHFKLRVGFFQFETTTIQEHLKSYIEKLQRQHCDYSPPDVMILPYHDLFEFMLLAQRQMPRLSTFIMYNSNWSSRFTPAVSSLQHNWPKIILQVQVIFKAFISLLCSRPFSS